MDCPCGCSPAALVRERVFDFQFQIFAHASGQILCSEPSGPPVEMVPGFHASLFCCFDCEYAKPCPDCGACV